MTIETAIYTLLKNNSGVAAIVGTKIYPNVEPQDVALPCIVYQRISDFGTYSQSGDSCLYRPRFQIRAIASTYSAMSGLSEAIIDALSGYKGTSDGITISGMFLESDSDDYGQINNWYSRILDFMVWHK